MKKIILVLLCFLFLFAIIRISTSTYENLTRDKINETTGLEDNYCSAGLKRRIRF